MGLRLRGGGGLKNRKNEISFAVVVLDDSLWRFGKEICFGWYTGFEDFRWRTKRQTIMGVCLYIDPRKSNFCFSNWGHTVLLCFLYEIWLLCFPMGLRSNNCLSDEGADNIGGVFIYRPPKIEFLHQRLGEHSFTLFSLWNAALLCFLWVCACGGRRAKKRKNEISFAVVLDESLWRFGKETCFGWYTGFEDIRWRAKRQTILGVCLYIDPRKPNFCFSAWGNTVLLCFLYEIQFYFVLQ